MAVRRKRKAGKIIFGLLALAAVVAVIFLLFARSRGNISVSENALGSIFSPIQNAVTSSINWIGEGVQGIRDYGKLQEDHSILEEELANAKLEIAQLEETSRENARLNEALNTQGRYGNLNPLFASVIAREASVWFNTFSVNRGSLNGIEAGMAVVDKSGNLVGHVYEVGLNYAKVITLIDTQSAASCIVERTRDQGVVRGVESGGSPNDGNKMYYIESVNNIAPGDRVLTSGTDRMYPKGLPVGTVREISRQSDGSRPYVLITPLVDFLRLEEVLILRVQVETDTEVLPQLPQATQAPTPEPTIAPAVSQEPLQTFSPDGQDGNWEYPTTDTPSEDDAQGTGKQPTDVDKTETSLPEDNWVE